MTLITLAISGDVPMARVKMAARHEYEYIANFKVLQTSFKGHKIDKVRVMAILYAYFVN